MSVLFSLNSVIGLTLFFPRLSTSLLFMQKNAYKLAREALDQFRPGKKFCLVQLSDRIQGLQQTWGEALRRHPDWERKGSSHTGPAQVRCSPFDSHNIILLKNNVGEWDTVSLRKCFGGKQYAKTSASSQRIKERMLARVNGRNASAPKASRKKNRKLMCNAIHASI